MKIKNLWKDKFIRIGCYCLIFLFAGLIIFEIIYKSYCQGGLLGPEIGFFVTIIKDSFQIIFFCVAVIITILSYLQAKKSLFTPIKTETFKMQIKAFEEIILFFQNKGETDFTSQFDFDNIVGMNAQLLMFDYTELFFKDEIKSDKEAVNKIRNNTAGVVISEGYRNKHFANPDFFEMGIKERNKEIANTELRLKEWESYEYEQIVFTKKFIAESEKLKNLSASPLIPQALKDKINVFERKIHSNLSLVGKVLSDISREMPKNFPDSKSLNTFNNVGVWNKYNKEKKRMDEDAYLILQFIREYLKIDDLIN